MLLSYLLKLLMLRDYLPKFLRKVLQADSGSANVESPAILTAVEQTEAESFTPLTPNTESTEIEQIIQKICPYSSMEPDSGVEFLIKAV